MNRFNPLKFFPSLKASAPEKQVVPKNLGKRMSKRNPAYAWMNSMFGGEYNPDKLDYRVYDDMLRDPQIQTALRLLSFTLRSKKWVVTPASEDPQDKEIAEFVEDVIENMTIPMRQVRADQLTAIPYGYAVGECVYRLRDDGMIVWDAIYSLPIQTIIDCFEYDDNGKIVKVHQNSTSLDPVTIDADKCLINTFDESFGNKYGQSILNQLYDTHFMKSNVMKWWAGYLDKLEGPSVIAESEDTEAVQGILDDMHEGTLNGVVPPGTKITLLESSHRGEGFKDAINFYDTVIFRAFMIGSLLLGQDGSQSGSYAQSQTHADTFATFCDGVHEDSAIAWQEQIKILVDYNYNTEKYPHFSFEPLNEKDLLGLLTALQTVASSNVMTPDELGYNELIPRILEQYANICIDPLDMQEQQQTSPDQIVPTHEDLNLPQPQDHNAIINDVMKQVQPK